MLTINILARAALAAATGVAIYRFVPRFGPVDVLNAGELCFLVSFLIIPMPWMRIVRPVDLQARRDQIPEEKIKIKCSGKSLSEGGCAAQQGEMYPIHLYLGIINDRARKRCRELEEDFSKEVPGPVLLLLLSLLFAYFKSVHPESFSAITPTDAQLFEVAGPLFYVTLVFGRVYGEVSAERKLNHDAAERF